eukprot:Blabericola_migrator_1__5009@NODE_25_length_21156_cov_56_925364_g22_i0_p1_GENE_NODE_25_length_21156_cov_56_925364_g22_i0NODE_25_length_21156_cov_56_925364_g22_i0_p1_ORF_typecomplete_len4304_score722_72SHRBD/PF06650_12/6_1e03SHRBD/PF06650_12/1_8e15SHRBD/PF06650_12/1_9e03VPS13_C/PF16909_5/1_3e07VPS13_C/PF16909_5/5_7e03Apt1/PF10351_9/2_7e02Apt1/PF10351_9/1_9_NODE_25_length_21156_cov_56_925364_g22_i087712912
MRQTKLLHVARNSQQLRSQSLSQGSLVGFPSGLGSMSRSSNLSRRNSGISTSGLSFEVEAAIDRWARLAKHIDFDMESSQPASRLSPTFDIASKPGTDANASEDSAAGNMIWKLSEDSFMIMHVKLGRCSLMVCASDTCTEHQENPPEVEYLRSQRRKGAYEAFLRGTDGLMTKMTNYHYAYTFQQTTYPLLSLHLHDTSAAIGIGTNGTMSIKAAVGDLRINEELTVCPANMTQIYSCSEFIEPVGFGPTISTFAERQDFKQKSHMLVHMESGFADAPCDEPVEELDLACQHYHRACQYGAQILSEQQELKPHMAINLSGNLTDMENVEITAAITPIRLTLPLEFVDELLAFATELTSLMPIVPLDTTAADSSSSVPISFQPLIARSLGVVFRGHSTDLEAMDPLNPSERRLVPRLRAVVELSAIEILIPIEPCRVPVKQQGKKAKFKQDIHTPTKKRPTMHLKPDALIMSPLSSPSNTPRIKIQSAPEESSIAITDARSSWTPSQIDQLRLVTEKWRKVSHLFRPENRIFGRKLKSEGGTFNMPMCLTIRAGVTIDATLFGYALSAVPRINPLPEHLLGRAVSEGDGGQSVYASSYVDSVTNRTPSVSDAVTYISSPQSPHPESTSGRSNVSWATRGGRSDETAASRKLFRFRKAVDVYRWVEACVRAPTPPNPTIRLFAPGEIEANVNVSSLTVAYLRPGATTPLRFPRIHWATATRVPHNPSMLSAAPSESATNREGVVKATLVAPAELTIAVNAALPSERTLWERYYGFSRQEAVEVRKLFGVMDPIDPEFVEIDIAVKTVSIDLGPSEVTETLKMLAVVGDFGTYQAERSERSTLFSQVATRAVALSDLDSDLAGRGDAVATPTADQVVAEPPPSSKKKEVLSDDDSSSTNSDVNSSDDDNDDELDFPGRSRQDDMDLRSIQELEFTEWLLEMGVPPTLSGGMYTYNVLNSFERMAVKVKLPLLQINLWSADASGESGLVQPRLRIFSLIMQDMNLSLRVIATSSVGHPAPWWASINPYEDILAGTDLIALSFVSYDFGPLIRNPYRAKPQRLHGLYHVVRDLLISIVSAQQNKRRKKKGTVPRVSKMDGTFRGSFSDVQKKVRAGLPWMAVEGGLTICVDQATQLPPLAASAVSESALLESTQLRFIGGKRAPETMFHLTTEMTWMNINISVHILDILLSWARDIFGFKVPDAIAQLSLQAYAKFRNRRLHKHKTGDLNLRTKKKVAKTSPSFVSMLSPNRLEDTLAVSKLDELVIPSFINRSKAVQQARSFLLGNSRCVKEQICAEQTSQALFFVRPPGAWDILNALEIALTNYMNILGVGFFQAARAGRTVQIISHFPSALPQQQDDSKIKKTVSIVAEAVFGVKSKNKDTRLLRISNQLGQTVGVYLDRTTQVTVPVGASGVMTIDSSASNAEHNVDAGWTLVPHGESFILPVKLTPSDRLSIPDFCLRFRLMNDVFDLRSTHELSDFIEAVHTAFQTEFHAKIAGKVEAPILKSLFRTFQVSVQAICPWQARARTSSLNVGMKKIRPTAGMKHRMTGGCMKLSTKRKSVAKMTRFMERELRLVRLYTKGLTCRKYIPFMCRLTPIPLQITIDYQDNVKQAFVASWAHELTLSSPFTIKNLAQEELVAIHTTPACPKSNDAAIHPAEDVLYSMAMKRAAELHENENWIINKEAFNGVDAWLSSREATAILFRLPPPPPPLDPPPAFDTSGRTLWNPTNENATSAMQASAFWKQSLATGLKRRRSADPQTRRDSVGHNLTISIVGRVSHLKGNAALIDYLVPYEGANTIEKLKISAVLRERQDALNRMCDKWPSHRSQLRSLCGNTYAYDGISALVLPSSAVDDDLDLHAIAGDQPNNPIPAMWPRTIPLHWLLSQQSDIHLVDGRTLKRVAASASAPRNDDFLRPIDVSPRAHTARAPRTSLPELEGRASYLKMSAIEPRHDGEILSHLSSCKLLDLQYLPLLEEKFSSVMVSSKTLSMSASAITEFTEVTHDLQALQKKMSRIDLPPRVVTLSTKKIFTIGKASIFDGSSESMADMPAHLVSLGANRAFKSAPPQGQGSRGSTRLPLMDGSDVATSHYATTAVVVTPDSTKAEGAAAAVEFCLSPLFEICNRLPRPLDVCNLTIEDIRNIRRRLRAGQAQGMSPSQALSREGRASVSGASPSGVPNEQEMTPLGKDISPSPIVTSRRSRGTGGLPEQGPSVFHVPAGENKLLPISEERVIFTFDHLFNPMGVNLRLPAENKLDKPIDLELIRQDRRRHRRAQQGLDMQEQQSSIKELNTSVFSDFGDASSVDASEFGDGEHVQDRYIVHLEIGPSNVLLVGSSNSSAGTVTNSDAIRMPCRTFMRTVTIYADTWVVNRLAYPLQLKSRGVSKLTPNKRAILSTDLQKDALRFSFKKGDFHLVPGSKFYGAAPVDDPFQWRRYAGSYEHVTSNSLKLGQYTAVASPLNIPGTDISPPLSLVAWLSRSPFPFLRTNTLEVYPAYVLVNDRSVPIYVRESPYKESISGETTIAFGSFMTVAPGGRIEFHPTRKKKNGSVIIQISALPEVERFHHVVVAAAAKQAATQADKNQDAPLWSCPVEISSAQVFQLRHPTSETTPLCVGYFELTEVSVTVRNGVKIIRFLNPDVPDYRLVNLSSLPLAVAQHKFDGPFEVLKPIKRQTLMDHALKMDKGSSGKGHGIHELIAKNTLNPASLTSVSVPFSFYKPSGPPTVEIWLPGFNRGRVTKTAGSPEDGDASDLDTGKNNVPPRGGSTREVVMRSRRKKLLQEEDDDWDTTMALKYSIMKIVGTEKKDDLRELEATLQQMEDIPDTTLQAWRTQKKGNSRTLDLKVQFDVDKKRKISGRRRIDRLMLLPLPNKKQKFVPIRVKLRFFAGCKWIVFDNYTGNIAALHLDTSAVTAPPPAASGVPPAPGQPRDQTRDLDRRRKINELYLKAQSKPDRAVQDLVTLCKYDDAALDELCRIWRFGSRDARFAVLTAYKEATKTDLKTVIKARRKLEQEQPGEEQANLDSGDELEAGREERETVEVGEEDDAYAIDAEEDPLAGTDVNDIAGTSRQHLEGDNYIIDPRVGTPPEVNMNIGCDIRFDGIGCDIMDSRTCRDMLYISAAKICIAAEVIQAEELRMLLSIGWLQIDNTLKEAYYPTVIRPIVDLHASKRLQASFSGANQDNFDMMRNMRVVAFPGEEPPDVFVFNDADLFPQDILARFGAPPNFEVVQIALENRMSPSPEQEDALTRYISYTNTALQDDNKKEQESKKQGHHHHHHRQRPKIQAIETEELKAKSPFVLFFKAQELPPPQAAHTAALVDIPLCALELSPLALNVDSPLIKAAAMMADSAFVLLNNFALNFLTGDATEIQQSENAPYSEAWKTYLGPVDNLITPQAGLGKISMAALEVGEIKLVMNVNISGSGASAVQSSVGSGTSPSGLERADSIDDSLQPLHRDHKPSQSTEMDLLRGESMRLSGSNSQNLIEPEIGVQSNMVQSTGDTRLQMGQLTKHFVRGNEDPALAADGDLTAGAAYDPSATAQTEQIRAVLAALVFQASMSDAQIELPARHFRDLAGPPDELAMEIISPYIARIAVGATKILGAIDLLGNPGLVMRHCCGGVVRAGKELEVGWFKSNRSYSQLHPGQAPPSRLLQPVVAAGYALKDVLLGVSSGGLECLSRLFVSWYNIFESLTRNADMYSMFDRSQIQLRRGGISEQPASLWEGCVAGYTNSIRLCAISLINTLYKPLRGCHIAYRNYQSAHWEDTEEGTIRYNSIRDDDAQAGYREGRGSCRDIAKHVSCSLLSATGSFLFGIFAGVLACCGQVASGALHHIVKIPMLQSVRPRRTFFRPGYGRELVFLKQFDPMFAYWAAFASSPAAFARFVGAGRVARIADNLKNVILAVPLALQDLSKEVSIPGVLLVGTQRLALMTHKGLRWHFPWKRLNTIDFVFEETGPFFFIRFIASDPASQAVTGLPGEAKPHIDVDKRFVFLIPCANLEVGWAQYQLLLTMLVPTLTD